MICRKVKASLPDLLLAPESVPAEMQAHVESCAECGRELKELQATMALMDAWEAPEISPWFDGRLEARLNDERKAAPAGFLERLRARWTFGEKVSVRPLAAATLALMIAIGGGVYEGVITQQPVPTPAQAASPVIRDLQSLDENAQVFQELNSMDQQQDTGDNGGSSL
ncbi:MAG: anti-sigma factor [Acidobacteriaceae bacterium]